MTGNCPKCGEPITRVNSSPIELQEADATLKGIAYLCPKCNSVISISIDPLAVITQAISEITHGMGKGFARGHAEKQPTRNA